MKYPQLILIAALSAFAAGCGGGGGSDNAAVDPPDPTFDQGVLGFVHTISDAPSLAIGLASTSSGLTSLAVEYGQRVLQARTVAGFDVQIAYNDGAGEAVTIFSRTGADNIKLFREDETLVWLTGTLANPTVVVVENEEFRFGVATGTSVAPQLQLFHGASAGQIDIYLTASGADLAAATPTATLSAGEHSAMLDITAGDNQQFRVTPAGDAATVLYDSGSVELAADTRTHVFVTDYFGPGDATITMRPVQNLAELSFAEESTTTELRLTNAVADVTTIDAHIGEPAGAPVIAGVPYRGTGSAQDIAAANVAFTVTADGMDSDVVLDATSVNVQPGTFIMGFVGGLLTDAGSNEARNTSGLFVGTQIRPIATGVQMQVFQGSNESGGSDFYILPAGETTDANDSTFTFALGGYGTGLFPTGTYDLYVTPTGSNTPSIGPISQTLTSGNFYTVLISDAPGGGGPFEMQVIEEPIP